MIQIINIIKARVTECKRAGNMFELPQLDIEGVIVTRQSIRGDGATLYHDVYGIKLTTGNIHIDYRSKNQCRSYQVRSDRSKAVETCSIPEYNISDAWDDNS